MRTSKSTVNTCRIVLMTSIVWFLLDIFLIYYIIDCNRSASPAVNTGGRFGSGGGDEGDGVEGGRMDRQIHTGTAIPQHEKFSPSGVTTKPEGVLAKLMKGLKFGHNGPGEMGKPVHIEKELESEMKEKFKSNQFNIMASDRIAINRTLPDVRMSQCRVKEYPDDMPQVSIIIVFHNEAWSTLLRSLHSVLNRSPRQYLREIILIDDKSDRDYLKDPLDAYVKLLPVPTHIVHLEDRSGLIVARLKGAKMALGPVLLFLDAHIEVTTGWLEPLLVRIRDDKKRVVAPIIDVISDDTFEYVTASDMTWGGFNWHLNFRWYPVPPRELERRNNDRSLPIQTPTIAGGLFAIDRDYFYEIGAYDEGMKIWGGENLEISFRVWMCGGSLEIATCSHVGHVFRKQTPYTFPGGTATIIHHNAARTAEVWMDNYKDFFYKMTPGARTVEVGDLRSRKRLRHKLRCKDFRWYLENIYKEAPVPLDFYSIGSVRPLTFDFDRCSSLDSQGSSGKIDIKSPIDNLCLDTMGHKEGEFAGLSPCHHLGGNQAWSLTSGGEIRSDEVCLGSSGAYSGAVKLERCHKNQGNQLWSYDQETKQLTHTPSGKCLGVKTNSDLRVSHCDEAKEEQLWVLENYQPRMHKG